MEVRIRVWVDGHEIDLAPGFRAIVERTAKKAAKPRPTRPTRSIGLKPVTGE